MRNACLQSLYEIAQKDKNVLSLIADNGMIVYDDFRKDMPEQYFNFGISEGHMITAAAGMASCGKIPYAYTIGAFLAYRCYEFIRLDVCLQKQNVKIVGIGAGMSYGYLGPTHHATEDIACLRPLPGIQIFSPATAHEARAIVQYSYEHFGPMYIRLGNNLGKELYAEDSTITIGKGSIIKQGSSGITLFVTGEILYQVLDVGERFAFLDIYPTIISIHTIKPLDTELILDYAAESQYVFTIEEHSIIGGLGGAVAELLAEYNCNTTLRRIGLRDCFARGYGSNQEVRMQNELDADGIYRTIKLIIEEGKS